jgi:hypothetical protein
MNLLAYGFYHYSSSVQFGTYMSLSERLVLKDLRCTELLGAQPGARRSNDSSILGKHRYGHMCDNRITTE